VDGFTHCRHPGMVTGASDTEVSSSPWIRPGRRRLDRSKTFVGAVVAWDRDRRPRGDGELLAIMACRHRVSASHAVRDPVFLDVDLEQ